MTWVILGFFILNPYPYLSTPYLYGEEYRFIMEMHRYIYKTYGLQRCLQNRGSYIYTVAKPTATGDGRRATSDGAVGVVVGGVATRPRRRTAGAVSTAAATCVGVGGRRATGGG